MSGSEAERPEGVFWVTAEQRHEMHTALSVLVPHWLEFTTLPIDDTAPLRPRGEVNWRWVVATVGLTQGEQIQAFARKYEVAEEAIILAFFLAAWAGGFALASGRTFSHEAELSEYVLREAAARIPRHGDQTIDLRVVMDQLNSWVEAAVAAEPDMLQQPGVAHGAVHVDDEHREQGDEPKQ